jgi:predicted nucleic acid-binding protein
VIFVDTGAWFALFVREDPDHRAATTWLVQNEEPLTTSDYVIDELLTLLRVRGQGKRAVEVGKGLFAEQLATVFWVTPEDVYQAWDFFSNFTDKGWSFTDCVSRAVMERMEVKRAFAFDRHFSQFGGVEVVPTI